jgi:hypothetical protein
VRQFGLDAAFKVMLTTDVNASLRLGAREVVPTTAPHGSIAASGWVIGAGASWTIARPTRRVSLELDATSDCMWLNFRASPNLGAVARSEGGFAWWIASGLASELTVVERVALELGVETGLVLIPITASDAGTKVTGIARGVVAGHAGIRVPF